MQIKEKPKLVFFRLIDDNLPDFIKAHLAEHIKCLSVFFDVILINESCDYKQICDKYEPDISLFESGIYVSHRLIKNTSSHPHIPKIGFCHADAYCLTRSVFLSDMEQWGVDTFFTLSVSMPDYTQTIADNLYTWPNFINPSIFKDYGQTKIIPFILAGSQATHYPWRKHINKIISKNYPSLSCPHFGWFSNKQTVKMMYGEKYAKMLNASLFAPTCGTIANELVRKHLEIPACKSCLITEKTSAVEAAGFVDMKNCVFADTTTLLDKIEYLLSNTDVLTEITLAGHELVNSRHTYLQRDQIYQWYLLNKTLKPNDKIIQVDPFGSLIVTNQYSGINNKVLVSNGTDRKLLETGTEKLIKGYYSEAEELFIRCLNFHYIPEAALQLGICYLYKGNSSLAKEVLADLIGRGIERHGAKLPDPVAWAYFIFSLLCQGSLKEAVRRVNQYPQLHHPELDNIRNLVNSLSDFNKKFNYFIQKEDISCLNSIHQLPRLKFEDWLTNKCTILAHCGQNELATRLSKLQPSITSNEIIFEYFSQKQLSISYDDKNIFPLLKIALHKKIYKWFVRKMRFLIGFICNNTQIKKYFYSSKKSDNCYDKIENIIEQIAKFIDIKAIFLVKASHEAFIAVSASIRSKNTPCYPLIFCANCSFNLFNELQQKYKYNLCFVDRTADIKKIKNTNNIHSFSLVIYDAHPDNNLTYTDFVGCDILIINSLRNYASYYMYEKFLQNPDYDLVSHEMVYGDFAIFQRRNIYCPDSLTSC